MIFNLFMNLIKACFKSLYLLVDLLSGCGFPMKISLALVWEFKCSNSKRFGKITHLLPVIFLVLFLFLQVAKKYNKLLKKEILQSWQQRCCSVSYTHILRNRNSWMYCCIICIMCYVCYDWNSGPTWPYLKS